MRPRFDIDAIRERLNRPAPAPAPVPAGRCRPAVCLACRGAVLVADRADLAGLRNDASLPGVLTLNADDYMPHRCAHHNQRPDYGDLDAKRRAFLERADHRAAITAGQGELF